MSPRNKKKMGKKKQAKGGNVCGGRFYDAPIQHRPVPNMTMDANRLRVAVLDTPKPERSATVNRFRQAYELIDSVEEYLRDHPATSTGVREIPIDQLVQDENYLSMCASLIRGWSMTDGRIGISSLAHANFPLPSCWCHLSDLRPIKDNKIQLVYLGAREFLVLTASALMLSGLGSQLAALQIAHELHAHADGKYDWLDWNILNSSDATLHLNQAYLRFALATVGIKAARRLYRDREERKVIPHDTVLKSAFLLDSIEVFARDQCQYGISCQAAAVGYWNLGWIFQQSVAKRGMHPLEGVAECLEMMRKCYETADEDEDDFLRANARIEAAMCCVLGGDGIVGYKVSGNKSIALTRNFRPEMKNSLEVKIYAGPEGLPLAAIEKEQRRLQEGIPSTRLDPDEYLMVARWDVLELWNEAMMGPYDALKSFGHECFVFGETRGWEVVIGFLKQTKNFAVGQLVKAPQNGFDAERDKGFAYTLSITCAACGKRDETFPQCTRCKKVSYCSRDCQVADWMNHKKTCKPVK